MIRTSMLAPAVAAVLGTTLLGTGVLGVGASPAHAASHPWTTHSFQKSASWHIKGFGCVHVEAKGSSAVQHWTTGYNPYAGTMMKYFTYGPRISNPTAVVSLTPGKCGTYGPYTHLPKAKKVTLSHQYYNSTCSASWSIGASVPWGVSAGVTPSCGNTKVLRRTTTYGAGSSFTQHNAGVVGVFKHQASSVTNYPRNCARVAASVTVYRKTASGQTSDNKHFNLGTVCG